MRYIKLFENFGEQTEQDIHKICEYYSITDYSINSDMSIDVYGDVIINDNIIGNLPIKFRKVEGDFFCNQAKLTTLKGVPKYVKGNFVCNLNYLTTLEDCPVYIGGYFDCSTNKLTTLKYSPKHIDGFININKNPLPSEILDLDGFDLKILIKHQEEYGIWNSDGTFNKARFYILLKDYDGGKLNND